jgi:hypothetical protein
MGIIAVALGLSFFSQAARADWTPAKRLSWNSGWSEYPAVAVDPSGNPHVVWDDDIAGNPVIYYKKSTDDPSGDLHVVWWSDAAGNLEIYYKKGK